MQTTLPETRPTCAARAVMIHEWHDAARRLKQLQQVVAHDIDAVAPPPTPILPPPLHDGLSCIAPMVPQACPRGAPM